MGQLQLHVLLKFLLHPHIFRPSTTSTPSWHSKVCHANTQRGPGTAGKALSILAVWHGVHGSFTSPFVMSSLIVPTGLFDLVPLSLGPCSVAS